MWNEFLLDFAKLLAILYTFDSSLAVFYTPRLGILYAPVDLLCVLVYHYVAAGWKRYFGREVCIERFWYFLTRLSINMPGGV
ncbi:hypothetical protein F4779DRAFT_607219 [Xylariaceae sp. FL0662B]|nr:hypothetical protein F4779DRAFT_607219 [Xylariaceae sp. FL0662B]